METDLPQDPGTEAAAPEPLRDVVDVRFRVAGRAGAYEAGSLDLAMHDLVVVQTERGPELGEISGPPRPRWPNEDVRLPRVLRLADERDLSRADHNRAQERRAQGAFASLAARHKLDAKLIRVDDRFGSRDGLERRHAAGRARHTHRRVVDLRPDCALRHRVG